MAATGNMKRSALINIDEPKVQLFSEATRFAGWYAGWTEFDELQVNGVKVISFTKVDRDDVRKIHAEYPVVTGFTFELETRTMCGCSELTLSVFSSNRRVARTSTILQANAAWQLKQRKLSKLSEVLNLASPHHRGSHCYDFMDQESATAAGLIESSSVSSHSYTPEMLDLIAAVPSGNWILDCGAGYRSTEFENVVLFEIEAYVSTDVRGVCERLPFKDNSFDLILSVVVLEHVKDPKAAVAEMTRVLKPGGKIWIDAAFMQPFHGYPNHFFNMTREGLRSLMPSDVIIEEEAVPEYGTPIWSLSWMLNRYRDGLPANRRALFENLKVSDLLVNPEDLKTNPLVTELSLEAVRDLAATNTIIVRKRQAT